VGEELLFLAAMRRSTGAVTVSDDRGLRERVLDSRGVHDTFSPRGTMADDRWQGPMTDEHERLTPVSPEDLAHALAFALRFEGRKRVHNAEEIMAKIVAKRLVDYLERHRFVVMQKPPIAGTAAVARGFDGGP
jgi:hypothetical protein